MTYRIDRIVPFIFLLIVSSCHPQKENKIDRFALVTRHNIHITEMDTLGPLSVGNGDFAFTMDFTGLQSFPLEYENGVPLGTQSNWGWHTFPMNETYTKEDVAVEYKSCNEKMVPYAVQHQSGRAGIATHWLRTNPHRLHLGIVGLSITDQEGKEIRPGQIEKINQSLDLWTGKVTSEFEYDRNRVKVETYCHQKNDLIAFRINSPLIKLGQLKIKIRFPYTNDCHTCAGYDWESREKHSSEVMEESKTNLLIRRTLDSTQYYVTVDWKNSGKVGNPEPHYFEVMPDDNEESIECVVGFSSTSPEKNVLDFNTTSANNQETWKAFWLSGGAIDFSECTDPRAAELERRVILSQHLTKIQCSGSLPPQETGLTMNSWYGKFHMEMHWWHGVHFALWNRPEYLENSLGWYFDNLEKARETAQWQGYQGARWQKMTSPDGKSSPSSVGEFLIWQQPHIIYFAELLYRKNPSADVMKKYQGLVFETADFMASFAQLNAEDSLYHLCPPLIPAQEHWRATETSDPAFELSYWYWGLRTAQKWRERAGLETNKNWQKVIENLASISENDQFYLPVAGALDAFTNMDKKRDHPIVIGAYGILPNERIDTIKMAHTFNNIMNEWNWDTTWGWDYPMLAMTATRLNRPEQAIEALFIDTQKNTYLINGHNYQDARLRIYLPGNGGLLSAVAMMAAGYEGCQVKNPGFPKNGKWDVKWEGLEPMF